MTVFVYVNTSKQVGDAEHVKVFATTDAAKTWFEENRLRWARELLQVPLHAPPRT